MININFCKGCGIALKSPNPLSLIFVKGEKIYQFDDGYYCEHCAKLRIDKRRRKL